MMWKPLLCGMTLLSFLAVWADNMMLIYDPARGPMLESPEVKAKLADLGRAAGYRVEEANDLATLLERTREETPALLVWGRSEVVEDEAWALITRVFASGGAVATGGGSPFYYRVKGEQMVAQGPSVSGELTGVPAVFASGKPGRIAPYGAFIFGRDGEAPGQNRGGTEVQIPGAVWQPLVFDADNPVIATAFVVAYPSGGRYFYYGADGLAFNALFNPLTAEGEKNWRTLLANFRRPLPQIGMSSGRREFFNDGKTPLAVTVTVENPSGQPMEIAGTVRISPAAGFGREGEAVECGKWSPQLAPGDRVQQTFTWQPPENAWGVYTAEFTTREGFSKELSLQLLPPGAVDYIDVDPLYALLPSVSRKLKIGLYSFLDRYDGKLTVTVVNDNDRILYDAPVALKRTPESVMTTVEVPLGTVERDLLIRAALSDPDGKLIHDSFLRVEASAANPAMVRRDVMFRAMNGIQFVEEPELPADLEALRDRMPLLRGLYIHQLQGDSRRWMHDHDFTLNYGLLLTDYPKIGKWGLDDRNAAGRSATEMMPGHPEDPARWLVWQHSRMYFKPILAARPEIVNLVEAVAGYQTPGTETPSDNAVEGEYTNMSDIIAGRRLPPEEMAGKVSHFFGYAPEAVWRHREALSARDGGLRILEPGGKNFRRVHLPELYLDLFNEPLPSAEELGFRSYDEYEPIPLGLSHENGYFLNDTELKRYQVHYLIRCYFHLKRLDDLSAYLRAFAPEVHCVIGHDGPLVAQLSDVLYRLPYLDTQTRWLFRSAYVMANDTTFGAERHWVMLGKLYGKRVGIHEEIGGGQWAPYRTEKTSFVSLFTKRAALPYRDLQVDFYHNRGKTYRVAEETAMFRGFQTAVDTGARPANDAAKLLVVETNNSHYPANYQGNYRWDLMMPPEPILSVPDFLRASGRYFHSTHTPLFTATELARYETVWLAAERYRHGDLGIVREWLTSPQPGTRTLILNHVGTLHSNYLSGMKMLELNAARPGDWKELGLPEAQLSKKSVASVRCADGREFRFSQPLPVILAAMPEGGVALAADPDGNALVWSVEVMPGRRIIYSGLPFNNIFESETDRETLYALGEAVLLSAPSLPRSYAISPERWFGMGYRLTDGSLAVALLNPAEYQLAMSPYGADGDAVEAAQAALGKTEVHFRWLRATEPLRRLRLVNAWDGSDTGVEIVADEEGSIELTLPVNAAELYFLR